MSRIALIGENSVEYVNILLEIWNCGDCAVLLDWRIPLTTSFKMMREADVSICYIEKKLLEQTEINDFLDIQFRTYENHNECSTFLPSVAYYKYKPNYSFDEAVILYSSGTTGKAKGISLSHFAINTNADSIIDYMQPGPDDCMYIVRALSHSSALVGELLVAMKTKMRLVIAPTIVLPRQIVKTIKVKCVTILCLNPSLLQLIVREYEKNEVDIQPLRTVYVSGAIFKEQLCEQAHKVFKNISIYNVYGLTEAGPRVTAQTDAWCKGNSVGKAIKGVEVKIVDNEGKCVHKGEKGLIHVNTRSIYSGYVLGQLKHVSKYKGWLNTGDIGFFDEYDELHIVDRIDDVIIVDAHNVYPLDVEQEIIKRTEIKECVVTAFEMNNCIYVGCLYVAEYELHGLNKELRKCLAPYEIPRFFLKCDSIPVTNNGKISKVQCRLLLEEKVRRKTDG